MAAGDFAVVIVLGCVASPAASASRRPHEGRYIDVRQVAAAAGLLGLVITFLVHLGLRFGEAAALGATRVDIGTRRVEVAESVTAVNGVLI